MTLREGAADDSLPRIANHPTLFGGETVSDSLAVILRKDPVVDAGSAVPRGASWGANDLIAYVPHSNTETPMEPAPMFDYLQLSPDGTRAAVLMPGSTGDEEVWGVDLVRGVRTRLVTPAPWGYHDPVWSEDGRQVLYVSTEAGSWDFYIRSATR